MSDQPDHHSGDHTFAHHHARILFGECDLADRDNPFHVWQQFRLDVQEMDWDSENFMVICNAETGSACQVIVHGPQDVATGFAEMRKRMDDVTWVLFYMEAWSKVFDHVPVPADVGDLSTAEGREESKIALILSRHYSRMTMLTRSSGEWLTEIKGDAVYDPSTNIGSAAITIRKEMDW